MSKLIKTRQLLKCLIDKERTIQIGSPTTDLDIKECVEEMESIEIKYKRFRNAFYFLGAVALLRFVLNLL
jgi:hypothetical protein